jgi:hypothetical protein
MNKEFLKMQKLAGLITESQYKARLNEKLGNRNNTPLIKDEWNEAIDQLIGLYSSGDDNEYRPGYEHEFNQNVELDTNDDLIPFYNFLKTQPKKTHTGYYRNVPVSVTANTQYEDEDLGDLIVKFTEPDSWDNEM